MKADESANVPLGLIASDARVYRLRNESGVRDLFVDDGISDGWYFATYYRTPKGSFRRFRSPALPLRGSRVIAQADLDLYAEKHRLRRVALPGDPQTTGGPDEPE
jgi:hypothetical protein